MKIASGIRHPMTEKVPGLAPKIVNMNTEIRFPAPSVTIPALKVIEVSNEVGDSLIRRFGLQGLVAVGLDQTDEDALLEAKAKRLDFLEEAMNRFREINSLRKAQGNDLIIPRKRHRDMLKELQGLRAELAAQNAELYAEIEAKAADRVVDTSLAGLEEFGINVETAPMVPGLTPAEAGIG